MPPRAVDEPRLFLTAVFVALMLVVGAAAGAAVTIRRGAVYEGSALLDVSPVDGAPNPIELDRYVQTQIPIMFAIAANSSREALGAASLSIRQEGSTALVRVAATGDNKEAILNAIQRTIDAYVAERNRAWAEDIKAARSELDKEIGATLAALRRLDATPVVPNNASTPSTAGGERNALSAEYQRLLAEQNQLAFREATSSAPAVVRSATADDIGRIDSVSRTAAIGALLGTLAGLLVVIAYRQWAASRRARRQLAREQAFMDRRPR